MRRDCATRARGRKGNPKAEVLPSEEVRGQGSEVRGRRSEVSKKGREPKSEIRNPKSENRRGRVAKMTKLWFWEAKSTAQKEYDARIRRIEAKLARLRPVPGQKHKPTLELRLSGTELRAFEEQHRITLPESYTRFLLKAGNGGTLNAVCSWARHAPDSANLEPEENGKEINRYSQGHRCWPLVRADSGR